MSHRKRLKKARRLIKDFKNWTDGPLAKDKHGASVEPESKEASRWCAIGALEFVTQKSGNLDKLQTLLDETCHDLYHYDIIDLNEDYEIGPKKICG